MSKLLVIRHSKTKANEEGILMGGSFKMNDGLSENGIKIAQKKGIELRNSNFKPTRVYCSELNRAIQTAEIILEELGLNLELMRLSGLNERDFGKHDGKPYKSVLDAFDKYGDNPPTIETVGHFIKRVTMALDQIKNETIGTTLVVTHSNPVMVMQTALLKPASLDKFWELGDPEYCEGFEYSF